MIYKKNGYAYRRPSYVVDPNAQISAGMVAFLAEVNGATVATVAASGTVPIGTFWNDHNLSYERATLESHTFNANNIVTVNGGNIHSTGAVKVTSEDGATVHTQGVDYTVNTTNGVITRVAGQGIAAAATVVVWYTYIVSAAAINYFGGTNYDRVPDDCLGSSQIAVVEGWAHIYTDQFDVTQTYALNDSLRADANSQWSTAATAYPICGRVVKVPTVSDPWLGVCQITVAA